jgi:protein-L-isoaspartate(D-aspartate) O-methyltransferase
MNPRDKKPGGATFPLRLDKVEPAPRRLVTAPLATVPAPAVGHPAQVPHSITRAARQAVHAPAAQGGSRPAQPPAARLAVEAQRPLLRPQRLLHQAVQDSLRMTAPTGLGLDSDGVRRRMVERLSAGGIHDARVLQAMGGVLRHAFVDTALAGQAYEDTSLPIGLGQTISKPSSVARMIELLCRRPGLPPHEPRPLGKVLEIGTGCGYQAAVLSLLARQVVSIERLRPLHEKARANLAAAGLRSPRLVWGDGMLGHAPSAPYDCIIAAAGGQALPPAWLDQLALGGRLVAPMEGPGGRGQILVVVDRLADGRLVHSQQEAVHFVPLKSGVS